MNGKRFIAELADICGVSVGSVLTCLQRGLAAASAIYYAEHTQRPYAECLEEAWLGVERQSEWPRFW